MGQPLHTGLLLAGARLGKYKLLRRLAIGGMAEIFLARVEGLQGFERLVVLKRILPQLALNEEFVRMFLDEARLAGTLHHHNIAQVYDIGRVGGSYFFTMEYVHGKDLREVIRAYRRVGQPLPFAHALSIIVGACAGLHYAHDKVGSDGLPLCVVHRDVSPGNVLVTYDGGIKVVDFGVAKARTRQTETRAGTLKGKISYMSPEQCKGEPLDRRSDVFALGILLFELSTGTRLFRGENEFATMQKIVHEDAPRPSTRRADYPAALEAIVLKALARDREQRFATAQELQLAVEEVARQTQLALSASELSKYLRELFGAELSAQPIDAFDVPSGPIVLEEGPPVDDGVDEYEVSGGEPGAAAPPTDDARRRTLWRTAAIAALSSALTLGAAALWVGSRHVASAPSPVLAMGSTHAPPAHHLPELWARGPEPAASVGAAAASSGAASAAGPFAGVSAFAAALSQAGPEASGLVAANARHAHKAARAGRAATAAKPPDWDPDSPFLPPHARP